jgi:hypothetical protein
MLFEGLKESLGRHARLVAMGSMCTAIVGSASVALAGHDDWEDDCDAPPTCEIIGTEDHYGTPVIYIPECPRFCDRDGSCDDGTVCAWVDLPCPGARGMTIKLKGMRPTGEYVEIESVWRRDKDQRQKVFFELPNFCDFEEGKVLRLKVVVKDDETNQYTSCEFEVHVVCGKRPECEFNGQLCDEVRDESPMMIYDVVPGDILPVLELCAHSRCYERARVELFARPPFMEPIGHAKSGRGQTVCISTRENDVVEGGFAEGTYWAKFKCSDVLSGRFRVLKVGFRYTDPPVVEECEEPPTCEILEGSSISVDPGTTATVTVCTDSPCEHCGSTLLASSVPGFVSVSQPGENCVTYAISPTGDDAGGYTATFVATDCNGRTSECSIDITVNAPAPVVACEEDEAQSPNGTFADATVISSGECIDESGVSIHGVIDTPVFMNGDVDYFRVNGLTPGEVYTATILAGMNGSNGFTDTVLGWLAGPGIVIAADDNSGPRAVYSKIEFIADESGVATLAVSGHGDDDFDGRMDGSMPYAEYGFGGYMLSIRGVNTAGEMPLERQADLNNDGVVDTADLGVLIGLFGATN